MNLVDSCGWREYFAGGPNAAFFAPAIEDTRDLIVPTVCLLEVSKRMLEQRGEAAALQAITCMLEGRVVALDSAIALGAARLGPPGPSHHAAGPEPHVPRVPGCRGGRRLQAGFAMSKRGAIRNQAVLSPKSET